MNLLADLRLAWRRLAAAPAFTGLVLFTLGLGLAATTTLFAVVETVMLRPLPYPDSGRLVRVFETFPFAGAFAGFGRGSVAYPNYLDWRDEARGFTGMAGYSGAAVSLQEGDTPERLNAYAVTANLFDVLGKEALLGRTFVAGEDQPGAANVVVISHGLWQRRFAGDRELVGRELRIDGELHTVIGVMPSRFWFPAGHAEVDLWIPLVPPTQQAEARGWHWMAVLARLADGTSVEAAEAEMERLTALIEERHPDNQEDRRADVVPYHEVITGDVRPMLLVLLGAAALVLLIAWANAANLQLVRAVGRRRELATRAALGAGTWRIAAVFLAEALLLAGGGAVLGLALAVAALRAIRSGADDLLPRAAELTLQPAVFAVLALLTVVTAVACAVLPAIQATRGALHDELKEGGRGGSVRSGQGFRRGLVVAQVALSVVLLVGTGLLVRTLGALLAVDPGVRAENVLTAHLAVAPAGEDDDPTTRIYRPVLERLRALPGVESAGCIDLLPLEAFGSNGNFTISGRPPAPSLAETPFAEWRTVSPGYFATLGIPLLAGRDFGDDEAPGDRVLIVNRALADAYFPEGAVGQSLGLGGGPTEEYHRIVGVVADVRGGGLDRDPAPELYQPYTTARSGEMALVVRSREAPANLATTLATVVRAVDAGQPIYDVRPMTEVVDASVADRRVFLAVLGGFAVVALALTMAGIYGVVAFAVSSRRREIGIRMALGASAPSVRRMVLRQAGTLAGLGVAIGLPASLLLGRLLASVLYGVAPTDATTLVAVAVLLALVAVVASWIPARRATRIPPMVALRTE